MKRDFRSRAFRIPGGWWLAMLLLLGCGAASPAQTTSSQDGSQTPAGTPGVQNPFLGGVPSGQVTAEPMQLSLPEAVTLGLERNLGVLMTEQSLRAATGKRWKELSGLLPNVSGSTSQSRDVINLASMGFTGFPGIPQIIGPFNVFDARLFVSQEIFDLSKVYDVRASRETERAARCSYDEARNLVVLVVSNLYFQTVAAASRIQAAEDQLKTAQAVYDLSVDLNRSGITPAIDKVRAQVELQTEQQRLTTFRNDFALMKLALARATGIPLGQEIVLTDQLSDARPPALSLDEALHVAFASRSDLLSADRLVRAAEDSLSSAKFDRIPSFGFDANYGTTGQTTSGAHSTYTLAASIRIPIFQGGETHGRIIEADALLKQRKAQRDDLRARIEFEVRSAMMDFESSSQNVEVARGTLELARSTLEMARDRFSSGITNNIEVIQAQQALSQANENYISSLYQFSLSKGAMARAMGVAEKSFQQFFSGVQ
jgi:outer membrane protein TolC